MQPPSESSRPNEDWHALAAQGLRVIALNNATFTSDEVWEWMGDLDIEPPEPRAMGHVFKRAYRDHTIVPMNEWRESRRRIAHRRPVRIWRSLVTLPT